MQSTMSPPKALPNPRTSRWQRLSPVLRTLWLLWAAMVSLVVVGTCLFQLSVYQPQQPLTLRAGESIQTSVWRPMAHPVQFSLRFERAPGQSRPELGEWVTPSIQPEGPVVPSLVFSKPGEPIKVLVEIDGKQAVYTALPASSQSEGAVERPLTPWVESANPGEIAWPPATQRAMAQAAGKSQFHITVQEVGGALQGEKVQLLIQPPLNFKSAQPGYDSLWLMFFWPTYAALLVLAGAGWCHPALDQRQTPPTTQRP